MARSQRSRVEPVFHQPADLVVLDHHIGVRHQRMHRRLPLGRGDVDRPALLAAVAGVEIGGVAIFALGIVEEGRPPMPGVVAFARTLDLHHLGAQIGEQLPAPGPGEDPRQLDDSDSRQRLHGRWIS